MHPSPKSQKRFQAIKVAWHGWLIKIGLQPPPDELSNTEKQLSQEQEQAQRDLRFHQQRRPRYW